MILIEHILGALAMLYCTGVLVTLMLYACVVAGSRSDAHIERHWDGEVLK